MDECTQCILLISFLLAYTPVFNGWSHCARSCSVQEQLWQLSYFCFQSVVQKLWKSASYIGVMLVLSVALQYTSAYTYCLQCFLPSFTCYLTVKQKLWNKEPGCVITPFIAPYSLTHCKAQVELGMMVKSSSLEVSKKRVGVALRTMVCGHGEVELGLD